MFQPRTNAVFHLRIILSGIDRNQMKIHIGESKYVGDSRRSVVLEEIMPCLLFVVIEILVE